MFAITGITGNVGGTIADTLLQHGKKVRGIVRDGAKARAWQDKGVEIFVSNYDENLSEAFKGVEGVFVMIPPNLLPEPGFPDSVAKIAAIKKAVIAAKPPRAVFLSSWGSEQPSGLGIVTTNRILEQELSDTGIPSAFLRPAWFMENIVYSLPAARSTGKYFSFYQPLERAYAMAATKDVGRIGAEVLLQSWKGNRVIEISVPPIIPAMTSPPHSKPRLASPSPPWPFLAKAGWKPWLRTECQPTVPVHISNSLTA
jgi:uncharacterized protein YbjT (DUF2867 family)